MCKNTILSSRKRKNSHFFIIFANYKQVFIPPDSNL